MAPRLQTNYSIAYSSNSYTITYADTYASVTFLGSDTLIYNHPTNANYFYIGALDFLTLLDFTKCTSPSGGSRSAVTAAITALSVTTALTLPVSVANGGTGVSTVTGYAKGSGTSAMTAVATIPVADGGTGANTLTGYAKGSGTSAFTAVATIPVADGGTGANTLTGYAKGSGTAALTAVATIPVADGGTGANTLTGYVKGSGTSAMTGVATIPVSDGGTGANTLTGLLVGNGTSAVSVAPEQQTFTCTYSGPVTTSSLDHKISLHSKVVFINFPDFGSPTSGALAVWTSSANLPSQYRPASTKRMLVLGQNGGAGAAQRLTVGTDGSLVFSLIGGGTFSSGVTTNIFPQTICYTLD